MASYGQKSRTRERHGKSKSRAYNVWSGIIGRCDNPDDPAYENYGGRGINYCPKWRLFSGFYEDMGDPPRKMTLDRIDNDKGYSLENCRWADRKTQSRNRRGRREISAFGQTLLLSEWAEKTGLKSFTIRARIENGWSAEEALTLPTKHKRKGIPRGHKIKDQYGDRHGVRWSEPHPDERASA